MSRHHLKLNKSKTQLLPLGTWQQVSRLDLRSTNFGGLDLEFCSVATNLGVVLDTNLSMRYHVNQIVRSCSFQLRKLQTIKRYLNKDVIRSLTHAFVCSRLDYCNSLLFGVSDRLMAKLQSIQNCAARFIEGGTKFEHASPLVRQLHWLPVNKRIVFKIGVIVFKCLNGLAPKYLMDSCISKTCLPSLRSSNLNYLSVPSTNLVVGSRNFAVVGPDIWNNLPQDLRRPGLTLAQYRRGLKTYLFEN